MVERSPRSGRDDDDRGRERPPAIRLDDLADPCYPGGVTADARRPGGVRRDTRLTRTPCWQAATERTGLDDFGDRRFVSGSTCCALACATRPGCPTSASAWSSNSSWATWSTGCGSRTSSRRIPRSTTSRSSGPIIICGLPRTGTTHLHNLIAADPAIRSLPYWESLEPFPGTPARTSRPAGTAVRAGLQIVDTAMPDFKRMHEMTVDHAHEEIQFLAIDFSAMLFETTRLLPTSRRTTRPTTRRRRTPICKRILQALQWLRGGTRWVLKSPQHLEQFPALSSTFPDATFVVTHRDPVAVIQSMATMISYSSRMMTLTDPTRRRSAATGSTAPTICSTDACATATCCPPTSPSTCGSRTSWPTKPGTVAAIYELAGQPLRRAGACARWRSSASSIRAAGTAA